MDKFERCSGFLTKFIALLLVGLAAGCGGGQDSILGSGGSNVVVPVVPDTTRPRVVSTVPATTGSGVPGGNIATPGQPTNTLITALFTEEMAQASITAAGTVTVTCAPACLNGASLAGNASYAPGSRTMLFTPTPAGTLLEAGKTYTVTITSAATDASPAANALAGNQANLPAASSYIWTFSTTAGPPGAIPPGAACAAGAGPTIPAVTSSDPTDGNQVATTSTNGVANGGKLITATFSLAMDPTTINATTFTVAPTGGPVLIPASLSYNAATNVATLTTSSALLPDTSYTAIITQGVTSLAGTPPSCTFAWTFRTITPAAIGLAPVNLGLAAPFAIASAAGLTNTGTAPNTTINGNVVLDPTPTCNAVAVDFAGGFGLCGGFAPIINGTVISPLFPADAGATSGAIKADLNAAYLSITPANLPGATVLGCGTIGSAGDAGALVGCAGNSILPPGVYISATASTIGVTGVLTLDGGGDSDARFIFQAPSALTTAAGAFAAPGSEIRLIGGAKASNVFWQVGSDATIGTFALFQGNVLADRSITMGTSSTSCGRLLAGAITATGQFVFDSNVVSVPGNVNAPPTCN